MILNNSNIYCKIYEGMQTREITAVFLAAVLVTGALTIAAPAFVENAEASSEKKKKYDRDYK
ncbi:MAG: hypothetical protein ACPKPY_00215, partial [Nitrososphaeraceae archaeon]